MTPLKETLEVTTSAETTAAGGIERPKPQSGGLRADAVSLEVPVKVHGSRVTDVVRGVTPHTEPFEEETATMIVFPQGGVLRMTMSVSAGQMMVVTNLKSGHDAICRVVKVRANAQPPSYVEIEFTNRQQGYWGVKFQGDADEPAQTILPPPPAPAISTSVEVSPESAVRPAIEPAPKPPVFVAPAKAAMPPSARTPQSAKKESSFVSIGSQEDVQLAATPTVPKPARQERTAASTASLSMSEMLGDTTAAPPSRLALGAGVPGEATDLSDDLADVAQGTLRGDASGETGSHPHETAASSAAQRVFGARFDTMASPESEIATDAPSASGTNWFLIATGVAALLLVAVGGGLYFRVLPGSRATARTESAPPAMTAPASAVTASPVSSTSGGAATPAASAAAQPAQPTAAPVSVAPPNSSIHVSEVTTTEGSAGRTPVAERVQPPAPASPKAAKPAPATFSASTAHPVASQRISSGDAEAPALDAGQSANADLQGLSSAADVAPPPVAALPRIKVGGDVRQPKLISSVMPVYPSTARSAGVTGNVVVVASISTTGAVVATKVLSGPVMLRQAAVDAVKRWKYQPGTLNGDPVAVDISVTMSFH